MPRFHRLQAAATVKLPLNLIKRSAWGFGVRGQVADGLRSEVGAGRHTGSASSRIQIKVSTVNKSFAACLRQAWPCEGGWMHAHEKRVKARTETHPRCGTETRPRRR